MNILSVIVSGVISGIIASLGAQLIIHISKPKIVISDEISKEIINGKPEYRIKIINKSKFYAKDMSIQVQLVSRTNAPDGDLFFTKPIPLVRKDISYIEPFNKNDKDAKYAIRVRLDANIEEIWKDDTYEYIEIKVFCTNDFNGAGKIFSKEYKKRTKIVVGSFETKESTKIVKS